MLKLFFKISKKIHKYIGLFLVVYMFYMSLSGILLNHPSLIEGISVSGVLVPDSYEVRNWNRGAFRGAVNSSDQKKTWIFGSTGIWLSEKRGQQPQAFMDGEFPAGAYGRRVRDLQVVNRGEVELLFASTYSGVYFCDTSSGKWRDITPDAKDSRFIKTYISNDKIYAVSRSGFYVSDFNEVFEFRKVEVKRNIDKSTRSMISLFFHLHDGSVWGTPGKLIFDFVALIIIFLCITAVYIWFIPGKWKRGGKKGKKPKDSEKRYMKIFYKYHLKLGVWTVLISLIIGVTGLFMRPPLIMALFGKSMNERAYPSIGLHPWKKKIRNGYYDSATDKLILDCSDGIWEGAADLKGMFDKSDIKVPVFAMGASVFQKDSRGHMVVGSFGGLFGVDPEGKVYNYIKPAASVKPSGGRPRGFMAAGFYELPEGGAVAISYSRGLSQKYSSEFPMPEVVDAKRMSFWHWLFELHNGRLWKPVFGKMSIFITPLGALLFIFVLLSGLYDYFYRKKKKK